MLEFSNNKQLPNDELFLKGEKKMNSKVLILSHPKLTQVVQQVLAGMELPPEVIIKDVGFGGAIEFLNRHLETIKPNIIITGGAHWGMLNRSDYSTNVPIIPIPVTRFDLLQAALQACKFGKRMAVIHYEDELGFSKDVVKDLDCECHFFTFTSTEEASSLIQSLKESGIEVIIGAGLICALSEQFQLPSVLIHSKDSIMKIIEHVGRLETARLDIARTAQKWSMEFMKHPITYDVESHTANSRSFVPQLLPKRKKSESMENMEILEQFLFDRRFSSFIKRDISNDNPFVNDEYPFISLGAFVCKEGKNSFIPLLEKLEQAEEARAFYVLKEDECRVVLLTKHERTSEFLNKLMKSLQKSRSELFYGGISFPTLTKEVFTSKDTLSKKIYEAKVALELAKIGAVSDPVCVLEPSTPLSIIFQIMQQSGGLEPNLLIPLFGHRNTDKLLYTLRLLLDHGLSITAVANHLGTSRQTVYGLMQRIESLVGLLTDPEKRFSLSLELRMLEMSKAIENVSGSQKHLEPASQIV
jgi:predicted DNA-binding protein YlxM (UPF0122 family)